MTSPEKSAAISSSCPSCGAGMEVDNHAGVMRCPYCQHEVLLPKSQDSMPSWPSAEQFGSGFTTTVTVNGSPVTPLTPEQIAQNKRKALIYAVPFVAIVVVWLSFTFWNIFSDSSSTDSSSLTSPIIAPTKPADVIVAVGATAKVKSFEATVKDIDCSKKKVSKPDDPATSYDDEASTTAEGKFCVLSFSVKNVGAKTEYYYSDLQATSPTERVLDRNSTAEYYLNDGKTDLNEPIDPGKVVDQRLVYDVPVDTTLAYLRLLADGYNEPAVKVKFS